jgi:hypothetical protein
VAKSEELPTRLTERAQMGRVFEYSSDFDENGVIHYLGTNGRKNEWKNPALTGTNQLLLNQTALIFKTFVQVLLKLQRRRLKKAKKFIS